MFINGIFKENFLFSLVICQDGSTRMYNCDFSQSVVVSAFWIVDFGERNLHWPSIEKALTVRLKILLLACVQQKVSQGIGCTQSSLFLATPTSSLFYLGHI